MKFGNFKDRPVYYFWNTNSGGLNSIKGRRKEGICIRTAAHSDFENLRWHGIGETVTVGPFQLSDPLVYSADGYKSVEPSAILLSKRLKAVDDSEVLRNQVYYSHHSSYANFNAQERWSYIEWLSQGRPATRDEGHLLLFLEGLERRAIIENRDIPAIWQELYRLYQINSEARYSFRYVAKQLLWFLIPRAQETISLEQIQFFAQSLSPLSDWSSEPEIHLSLLLWWCERQLGEIPQWMAYECARVSLLSRRTVVVERAPAELRQLFAQRFNKTWGSSVPVALPPKARRRIEYSIRNYSIRKDVRISWPCPLKLTSEWRKLDSSLSNLFNQCQQELRPLALVLGKDGVTRDSVRAWEATPDALRKGEHPARAKFLSLGGEQFQKTGFYGAIAGQLAEQIDVTERVSLTPTVSKQLADSLQICGFAIEPDVRLTGKSYKWDTPAVLFAWPGKSTVVGNVVSLLGQHEINRYQTCAFLLKLAFYVAQASGPVSQNTLTLIATTLSKEFDWNDDDRQRFKALAGLILWRGLEASSIRAPIASFAPYIVKYDVEVIKQLLLKLVAPEKKIDRAQEEALRFAWKRLNLDLRLLNTEMDKLSQGGVIFIGQTIASAKGERIPPPPESHVVNAPLQLDMAAIDALLEDTRYVQATLGAAMAEGEAQEIEAQSLESAKPETQTEATVKSEVVIPEPVADFRGLAPRFSPLLRELLERDVWSEQEAKQLAQRHSVMLAGALEAINDWSFEEFGTLLIWEEDATLTIERTLLQQTE